MPLRRKYTTTFNGRLTVVDAQAGNISQHYQNLVVPPIGLIAADLEVDTSLGITMTPNGQSEAAIGSAYELLGLVVADLGLRAPNPRAF